MKRTMRLVALAATFVALGAAALPDAGWGGVYTVEACQSAKRWGYGSDAFELGRSNGLLELDRGCGEWGRIGRERGLTVTVKRKSARKVANGTYARALFRAPAGMRIARVDWSGSLKRCDAAWLAGVGASGGGPGRWVMLPGRNRFTVGCRTRVRRSAAPAPARLPRVAGATAIYSQVKCARRGGCSVDALRGGEARADARTFAARVTLVDPTLPSVWNVGGNLLSGRWVSGRQALHFKAADNSGISLENVVGSRGSLGKIERSCNFARKIPCPKAGGGGLLADTARAPDGPQLLTLRVHDASGQARALGLRALIDNTPPAPVAVTVGGGEGWHRAGPLTVAWQNPAEPHRAPITAVRYQLRRVATAAWSDPETASAAGIARIVQAVEPGEWELRLWRVDAAGNADPAAASIPVKLRYDPEVPELGFERQNSADPARVSVLARERISGLAGGEIEVRREGDAAWHSVGTQLAGSRLVAHLDDARLPAGVYALRVRAADRAGNVGFGERRTDGFPAVISLPARGRSALRVGAVGRRTVKRRIRRGGRSRTIRRRVKRLVTKVRARPGRRVIVSGLLTGPSLGPLASAPIHAIEHPELAPVRPLGTLRTGPTGRFRLAVVASRNTVLRIGYRGSHKVLPAERQVRVQVPAQTAIRSSRRRVRNGGGVTFSGRVRTLPIPSAGKLVEIQAHFRGRWRTFQTVRSGADGRWRFRYRFGATVGRVRYRFRALLAAEGNYPYARGVSRKVSVIVTG